MPNINQLIKLTCILLSVSLSVLLVVLFFRYVAAAFLPFITAWSVALALKKPSEILAKQAKISQKAARIATTVAVTLFAVYIGFLIVSILVREGKELYFRITSDSTRLEGAVSELLYMIGSTLKKIPYFGSLPQIKDFSGNLDERILSFAGKFAPQLITTAGSLITRLAKFVPYLALFLLVTLISVFYFAVDLEHINRSLACLFPNKPRKVLFLIKDELFSVISGYFRAYSLIIALTFSELFVGLSIIGTEYAFLISFLIALVDVLPVFGTGTILIPWGVILLVSGNVRSGVGILVLYLIVTVIRQLAEPKIVGSFLGLHPLCTLVAVYVGARLAGVSGIFLFPIGAIVARNVVKKCISDESTRCVTREP